MMKKLLIAFAALSLTACSTAVVPTPVEVADRVVLDERIAVSVELAYKAARTAVETAVDAGLVKGDKATTLAALDRKAYTAVLAVRAAYNAGNAQSYNDAVLQAQVAISSITSILGK
jgi:hypothetical protein